MCVLTGTLFKEGTVDLGFSFMCGAALVSLVSHPIFDIGSWYPLGFPLLPLLQSRNSLGAVNRCRVMSSLLLFLICQNYWFFMPDGHVLKTTVSFIHDRLCLCLGKDVKPCPCYSILFRTVSSKLYCFL